MILKLQKFGLSKDIQAYWDRISYSPSPEDWALIIMNISLDPEYKKIENIKDLLDMKILNHEYTKYCTDYIDEYNRKMNEFKSLKSNQVYMLTDEDDIPVRLSNSYDDIVSEAKERLNEYRYAIDDKLTIYKVNIATCNENTDEYNFHDGEIMFDADFNIVQFSFKDFKQFPYGIGFEVKFPTDFKPNEVFKYCDPRGCDSDNLYMCLHTDDEFINGFPVYKTDSFTGNGIMSVVYSPKNNFIGEDHSAPMFFERLTPEDFDNYYDISDILKEYYLDGSKLQTELEKFLHHNEEEQS